MYCQEWTAVKKLNPGIKLVPLFCRSWACTECAPRRQKCLMAVGRDGEPNTFITLTTNPHRGHDPEARARRLVVAWKEVRRRARIEAKRDPNKKPTPAGPKPKGGWKRDKKGRVPRQVSLPDEELQFLAVFEEHESGEPHLHILCRSKWIDQRWLSLQMDSLNGAPVVDIQRVYDPALTAFYVAKYIAKHPRKFDGCKRYWWSKGYRLPKEDREHATDKGGWVLENVTIDRLIHDYEWGLGWTVTAKDGSAIIMKPPD